MKLLEFAGEIVEVGEGYVRIKRDADTPKGWLMRIPSEVEEERTVGRHLYARVRVTVEVVDREPAGAKETTP